MQLTVNKSVFLKKCWIQTLRGDFLPKFKLSLDDHFFAWVMNSQWNDWTKIQIIIYLNTSADFVMFKISQNLSRFLFNIASKLFNYHFGKTCCNLFSWADTNVVWIRLTLMPKGHVFFLATKHIISCVSGNSGLQVQPLHTYSTVQTQIGSACLCPKQ